MFFYFKSISLNSSALTGKSNTSADLQRQVALSLNDTPEKNHIPLAFILTCCYKELFLFAPPKIRIRKAWIIIEFQRPWWMLLVYKAYCVNLAEVFILSSHMFVLQGWHFNLLVEWRWVARPISLCGFSPFQVGWWKVLNSTRCDGNLHKVYTSLHIFRKGK